MDLQQFEPNVEFLHRHFLENSQIQTAKGQLISKQICRAITSPKKQTKLIILSIFSSQDSELRSFFGRSYGSTILFRN